MKLEIITIFPDLFNGFLNESLLARAQKKKIITIKTHNLRKWTTDKHKTVDDRPYGGGTGMLLKIEPIFKAVKSLTLRRIRQAHRGEFIEPQAQGSRKQNLSRTILLSAKGKTFTQKDARRLMKYDQLVFICGRYEGVDERVAKHIADEEISIGNYVLFGGEVASMVIIEAVSRLIPGVIKKEESVKNDSFSDKEAKEKEYPHYTRPETFIIKKKSFGGFNGFTVVRNSNHKLKTKKLRVPKVLLSGDYKKIHEWRKKKSKK